MKIWRELGVLILIFALIWLFFIWVPIPIPNENIKLSKEREKELAALIMDDLEDTYEFYPDSITEKLIKPITNRLVDSLDTPLYEYKFHLINNHNEINAFATIDGHIYIFSGLIKFVDNPEQLAGIIAHEIGHHENGDLVHRLIKDLGLRVLVTVMTGGDAVMTSKISELLISSSFNRKQESKADKFAYKLMSKALINPARLAHFFSKLKTEEKTYLDDLEIIMTHPNSKNRINEALSYPLSKDFNEQEFDMNWKIVIKEL